MNNQTMDELLKDAAAMPRYELEAYFAGYIKLFSGTNAALEVLDKAHSSLLRTIGDLKSQEETRSNAELRESVQSISGISAALYSAVKELMDAHSLAESYIMCPQEPTETGTLVLYPPSSKQKQG